MKLVQILVWLAATGGLIFYFFRFGLSHLYDYCVGTQGVEFRLFGTIRIFTIRFELIEDVTEQRIFRLVDSKPSSFFRGLVVGNRVSAVYVVLKLKRGIFRYVGITPADQTTFVEQVKQGLEDSNLR